MPLGAQAANTVLSRIAGDEPAVLNQAFVGTVRQPGPLRGQLSRSARTDDTPRRLYIGGRAAAAIKEFICKGTVDAIAGGPQAGFVLWYNSWLKGGKRPSHEVVTES